jgi:membrane protease YdiL (CAAX protease family)
MTAPALRTSRLGAYMRFVAAVIYFFAARGVAAHAALGLASESWSPLVEQILFVFLLLVGYSSMGFWFDKQMHPITEQGLPRRRGWTREAGLGIAAGWGIALVCVLAMAFAGGIATSFTWHLANLGWLIVNLVFFALVALGEDVAFRGYGFQSFAASVSPLGASLGYAAFYAILQAMIPGASHASICVGVVFSLLLSAAYVRTRALWVGWGLNFSWKASRALLFGLSVTGVNSRSPIVQGNPMGSFWLTGGAFGLDGSWFACLVMIAALPVVFRLTSDLNFLHNAPVIVPGGLAVDLDAVSRAQHEAAMGPAQPATPTLVQILPASAPPPLPTVLP